MKAILLALFPLGFATAIAWNVFAQRLFSHLRDIHPDTYQALGKPSIFRRGGNTWAVMRFIFSDQWRGLGDSRIEDWIRSMRVLFSVFAVIFSAMLIVFFIGWRVGSL